MGTNHSLKPLVSSHSIIQAMKYQIFSLILLIAGSSADLFSADQQAAILAAHNGFRSKLALGQYTSAGGEKFASATNMLTMVWNNTLATSASNYANTCPGLVHSEGPYGENLYIIWGGSANTLGADASNSWADEFYDYGSMGYAFTQSTGHATQMAWATTETVGCGYKFCSSDSSYLVVCQYYARGNMNGAQAYLQGTTCSACPTGKPCVTATGLCQASQTGATTTTAKTTTKATGTTTKSTGSACQQCAQNLTAYNEEYFQPLGTPAFSYRVDSSSNCLIADWYCQVAAPATTAGFIVYTGPGYTQELLNYNQVGQTKLGYNDTVAASIKANYKPFTCNNGQWSFNGVTDFVFDCFAFQN